MSIERGDEYWMRVALGLARRGEAAGEVPVGALVVCDGELIGEGWNQPIGSHDPTAHAEVIALRDAARRVSNYRLPGCTLYVTIEPCTMCAGALIHARVGRLVFGAQEPKSGAIISASRVLDNPALNYRVGYEGGVLKAECSGLIKDFFAQKRAVRALLRQAKP
jgi:tRNA(adenine34) deaminase